MGSAASVPMLADAITSAQNFLYVFASVYTLVILLYIVTSWLRLPYSIWLNRIQRFLYDVTEPYLRLFRRVLPSTGAFDFSPMIAVIVLWVAEQVLVQVLEQFH
ncbi:MAG TPA: YggT family protein [Gaiellaceae bacterium]|nr:YggT family protein [Gaiellaceae bacterium]